MAKPTRTHICPHLGLKSDPTTALHFASMGNYCYHVKPPEVPKDSHQNNYCLVAEHTQCPIFLAAEVKRMPHKYRAGKKGEPRKKRRIGTVPIAVGLLLLVLAVFLVPELGNLDSIIKLVFSEKPATATPTLETLQALFPTSAGTPTPTKGLRPFCQPPISWNPYIVKEGDTFEKLSVTYSRTVAELLRANCRSDASDLAVGERIYLPELPTPTPTDTPTVTPTKTRVRRTYVAPLPTWTGEYKVIPYTPTPTDTPTPTPVPTDTPTPPPTPVP